MILSEALKGVRQLYLETAPLIYSVGRMDALVAAAAHASILFVSSVITLAEVLARPLTAGDEQLVQQYKAILRQVASRQSRPILRRGPSAGHSF